MSGLAALGDASCKRDANWNAGGMFIMFVFVPLLFVATAVTIFLYIRASFQLLDDLQTQAPDVWEQLGRPERIYVRQARGGCHTIKPLMPWLGWIWRGDPTGLPGPVALGLVKTHRLLIAGLILFGMTVFAFLFLFATAPAD